MRGADILRHAAPDAIALIEQVIATRATLVVEHEEANGEW